MRTREVAHRAKRRRTSAAILVLAWAVAAGCERPPGASLVIATDLDPTHLDDIAEAFRVWAGARTDALGVAPAIRWLRTSPGRDPSDTLSGRSTVDLVLTAYPAGDTGRLDRANELESIVLDEEDGRVASAWSFPIGGLGLLLDRDQFEARALTIPTGWDALGDPLLAGLIALDDPRRDPTTFALATARLSDGAWADGYEDLVRAAGQAAPMGRTPGSAEALVRRGGASIAPVTLDPPRPEFRLRVQEVPGHLTVRAGVARDAPGRDAARSFLRFLDDRYGLTPEPPRSAARSRLLARLLGATLVDAQDELAGAVEALGRNPSARLATFLVEAPPWPPASVQELARSDPSGALAAALAEQLASGLDAQTWLLQSWSRSPRPIDGRLLDELAEVADGKLAAEPRFVDWLATEWTTWASQRYRRVGRQVLAGPATAEPPTSGGGEP